MEKGNENRKNLNNTTSVADTVYDYLRYWKWFIVSVVICLVISAMGILVTQKEYKSSLSILLNEDKGSGKSNAAAELDLNALGLLSTTNNLDNEIAILSSPDLMYSVVDTLNLQAVYYINEKFRKIELYKESPFLVSFDPQKRGKIGNIEFSIQKNVSGYEVYGASGNYKINENLQVLPAKIKVDDIELTIQLTGKEVVEGEEYYVLINDIASTVSSLCSRLTVSPFSKTSSVLNLVFLGNSTEKGSAILRELIKQYNEMNVNIKNEIAYNTAIFINDRLKEISVELGSAEENVVNFKQENQITDLTTEAQLFVQQTGVNDQKLMDAETQINLISLIERFVNDPNNKLAVIPNIGISDLGLTQIIGDYNNKLLNSEVQLKGMGQDNPSYIRLTADINNMHNSIVNSLKNVKQSYNVAKQDILRQSSSTKSKVTSIPQQERGLIEKVREQQIKENLFLFLMQKREETNLSIASTPNKARIIVSPQENTPPIAPRTQIIIFTAFILGLVIPILVIYVRSLFKTQIKNRSELEKLSTIPIVGQIARNAVKDQIVIQSNQNSGIAEMFRSLRNNLNFIFYHKVNQLILVTSTTTGEGKTFVSLNLSMSFALSGKKVLLIGGDIRNPKLHRYLKLDNKRGLSDYLADEDPWENYVSDSELHKNLKIMQSGTIPPNPNELLMNPRLKELLSAVKKEYDFIIIDTAPVGLVSDTYLIDEYVDATLYIVREGITPKTAVNFMNAQKEEGKLMNMYLVLNDSHLDSNYKYGYGKAYGYQIK